LSLFLSTNTSSDDHVAIFTSRADHGIALERRCGRPMVEVVVG
jgi:hypothetical protein